MNLLRSCALGVALLLCLPVTGVAQSQGFSIPQDPVMFFFQRIFVPVSLGRQVGEADLIAMYRQHLSIETATRFNEDQFVGYWQTAARQRTGQLFAYALLVGGTVETTFDIGDPVFNDSRDKARIRVTIWVTYGPLLNRRRDSTTEFALVNREDGMWRLVLGDEAVANIQKVPTRVTSHRVAANRQATAGPLRLTVVTVSTDREVTSLEVRIENTSGNSIEMMNALVAATLTDDQGNTHPARTLRSTLPPTINPRQTVTGTLAFPAVRGRPRAAVVRIPEIQVGDQQVTLAVEIPLPSVPTARWPVPSRWSLSRASRSGYGVH